MWSKREPPIQNPEVICKRKKTSSHKQFAANSINGDVGTLPVRHVSLPSEVAPSCPVSYTSRLTTWAWFLTTPSSIWLLSALTLSQGLDTGSLGS